jgi:hypothetical protein
MRERSALQVFFAFLKLGATSFDGPIAHVGYFRDEFVVRRRWVNDAGGRVSMRSARRVVLSPPSSGARAIPPGLAQALCALEQDL